MWADIGKKFAYSIAEWCELTGFGRTFTYGEIARGKLKARKAGGRTVILDPDAKDYLFKLPLLAHVETQEGVDVRSAEPASDLSPIKGDGIDVARNPQSDCSSEIVQQAPRQRRDETSIINGSPVASTPKEEEGNERTQKETRRHRSSGSE
jgi:hypothetical protein